MEDFKQYLNEDAGEQERKAADQVAKGLNELRFENTVATVARQRHAWLQRSRWRRITAGIALVLITVAGMLYFKKKNTATPEPPGKTAPIENVVPPSLSAPMPHDQAPVKQVPMAQRPLSTREQAEKPLLRKTEPELDAVTNALIGKLLELTIRKGAAFSADQQAEKLQWDKIVKLLSQNKPAAAKAEIFKTDYNNLDTDWLLALALLEENRPEAALVIFGRIANTRQHPFGEAAQMAIETLQ